MIKNEEQTVETRKKWRKKKETKQIPSELYKESHYILLKWKQTHITNYENKLDKPREVLNPPTSESAKATNTWEAM